MQLDKQNYEIQVNLKEEHLNTTKWGGVGVHDFCMHRNYISEKKLFWTKRHLIFYWRKKQNLIIDSDKIMINLLKSWIFCLVAHTP